MRRGGVTWLPRLVGISRLLLPMAAVVAAASISACASISQNVAATMSQLPAVGLSENAPARPSDPPPYPAVHDLPPPRAGTVLTAIEQQSLEDDLVAARDRQLAGAGKPIPSRGKTAPSQGSLIPASSSRTIY